MAISTWDGLKTLGFVDDVDNPLAGLCPLLRCSLGKLDLRASLVIGRQMFEIVVLSAELHADGDHGQIEDDYPTEVESLEQLAALIAHTAMKILDPKAPVGALPLWFLKGIRDKHLLPWERELAVYQARPQCYAKRDWAKLAIKTLGDYVAQAADDTSVSFTFDGSLLTIRCGDQVCALPAAGTAWPATYEIAAARLRHLPKRLQGESIEFGVWEAALQIANCRYVGIAPSASTDGH